MKKAVIIPLATLISLNMSVASFAGTRLDGVQGQWKQNQAGWRWENIDSSYPVNEWVWLDGNGDNIAECYYFNERGYMVANRDVGGYWVNADGQWVDIYGTVQTKIVNNGLNNMPIAQNNINDAFAVQNDTDNVSVSQNNVDSDNVPEMFLPNGEPNMEYRNYLQNKVYERIAIEQAEKEQKEKERQERNAAEAQKNSDNDDGTSLEEKRERILNDINKYRKKAGKEPLELDDELNDYAQIRAEECEERYSHIRPNGEMFYIGLGQIVYSDGCGENIAVGTYKNVAKIWYNSPGHKRIMLGYYEKCGIGIYGDYITLDLIG